MQADFYRGYTQKLLNTASLGGSSGKPKKSHFPTLLEFINELDNWLVGPLDPNVDTEALVMTFSNVNEEVVNLNAQAIGIHSFPAFAAIGFGRLHDLVGRRNEIGHGSIVRPPSNADFVDLWTYAEGLINVYSETFKSWLLVRFPPPPAPTWIDRLATAATRVLRAFTGS
jgi:hypothetical protein